jgi:hypothetical protein
MKRILILPLFLLLAASPCFAQDAPGTAIDPTVAQSLDNLHRQLDMQYSKLRTTHPDRFRQQCAAGGCERLCTGGESCTCTANGGSCSCSECR